MFEFVLFNISIYRKLCTMYIDDVTLDRLCTGTTFNYQNYNKWKGSSKKIFFFLALCITIYYTYTVCITHLFQIMKFVVRNYVILLVSTENKLSILKVLIIDRCGVHCMCSTLWHSHTLCNSVYHEIIWWCKYIQKMTGHC